jgi:peptide/nickel transport system permease protein
MVEPGAPAGGRSASFASIIVGRLLKNPFALWGGAVVVLLFLVAALAHLISPYDPSAVDTGIILRPPGAAHWLGTDELGRDVLSRMIYGARISLMVGFVSIGIATVVGVIIGAVSGYYGGITDEIMMRFVDVMLTFPVFFLILAVIAILEPNIVNVMIVIGLTGWMGVARLVRAEFLSIKERDFVVAVRSIGQRDALIIFKHILPNAMAPVLVSATLGVAGAILTESALSFLGIGVQPPTPSWGSILTEGKNYIEFAWWLSVFPGLAILFTVLGYNLLGEALRDALDARIN